MEERAVGSRFNDVQMQEFRADFEEFKSRVEEHLTIYNGHIAVEEPRWREIIAIVKSISERQDLIYKDLLHLRKEVAEPVQFFNRGKSGVSGVKLITDIISWTGNTFMKLSFLAVVFYGIVHYYIEHFSSKQ